MLTNMKRFLVLIKLRLLVMRRQVLFALIRVFAWEDLYGLIGQIYSTIE